MKLIIFEDHLTESLKPFSFNHATFEIKTGLFSNLDRFIASFPKHEIYLIVRDEIKDVVKFRFPKYHVNPNIIPAGQCVNAKVVWDEEYTKLLDSENLFFFKNKSEISLEDFNSKIKLLKNDGSIPCINYLWDSIYLFNSTIKKDFFKINNKEIQDIDKVCVLNRNSIFINETANIKPGVVIDATNGPVYIGENVQIDIGALIQGPVFIDKDSYISLGSKIRGGTLIGPNCKIGGEVTNSIFHGFSNKVHDGFIGHSYIGEWVNIGAGTNNSNLKNNYSDVKFNFGKNIIDSNKKFLGTMIGDFTRISIGTSINTGTFVGIGSNLFNHNFNNKFVEPFSWGNDEKVDFDRFINTCKLMLKRRDYELHKTEENLLKYLYEIF